MANIATKLKKIKINQFRGLSGVEIDLGDKLTIICGKNGTSKSTILGVIAQIFSFRKDYSKTPPSDIDFKTLTETNFESRFQDHFRLSEKFDQPGSMDIEFTVFDGAFNQTLDELALKLYASEDRGKSRPIVRGNKVDGVSNTSRNVTHPLIYLSLARLVPVTLRPEYTIRSVAYLKKNEATFRAWNNKILIKSNSKNVTATTGTVKSIVAHSDKYDQDSVSVGEDNVGQILQALLSFKQLHEVYPDYHGGMLLIDEADAGLFPAAQIEFIKLLSKLSKDLNLQIVMTSHSPTMVEEVYNLSQKDKAGFKTIYLTDTYGKIEVLEQVSWPEIYADLRVETVAVNDDYFPKVNVYFEDVQGYDFYKALITRNDIKKITNNLNGINMSCSDLINLVSRDVPEFSKKSIIILDADVAQDKNYNKLKKKSNICLLPSDLPPDQLLFEFLYNLDADDSYWKNDAKLTKSVFLRIAGNIIQELNIDTDVDEKIILQNYLDEYRRKNQQFNGKIRDMFKIFSKEKEIKKLVEGKVKDNPYRYWARMNDEKSSNFINSFINALEYVLITGHGLDRARVANKLTK
ncbi:AAA family ATPase [Hafnia paralvei]|uniref:ATP-dependent nuclease n=1 Tax=Hafnia paralvei TaxID=546367 RepID=UPI00103491D0|nr:AAA family ATPase [Hafnia paralvei]TBM14743.1 AAA family ATPase [Hafnia paralvei]